MKAKTSSPSSVREMTIVGSFWQRSSASKKTAQPHSWCSLKRDTHGWRGCDEAEALWAVTWPLRTQLWAHAGVLFFTASTAALRAHPLSSPSPPAFNLSQHQGKDFSKVRGRTEVLKVAPEKKANGWPTCYQASSWTCGQPYALLSLLSPQKALPLFSARIPGGQ